MVVTYHGYQNVTGLYGGKCVKNVHDTKMIETLLFRLQKRHLKLFHCTRKRGPQLRVVAPQVAGWVFESQPRQI